MTAPQSSKSSPRASARIACDGTAFLADAPIHTMAFKCGVAPDVPQFSSPRLDASFLANCGRFLTGEEATMGSAPGVYFRRVTGTDFRLAKATHFYACSDKLCDLLADLTEQRVAEIADKWYGMRPNADATVSEPDGRAKQRSAILRNLSSLAKRAKMGQTKLMLRVDYRNQHTRCQETT